MNEEDIKALSGSMPDSLREAIFIYGSGNINLVKTNRPEEVQRKEVERLEKRLEEEKKKLSEILSPRTTSSKEINEKIQRLKSKLQ